MRDNWGALFAGILNQALADLSSPDPALAFDAAEFLFRDGPTYLEAIGGEEVSDPDWWRSYLLSGAPLQMTNGRKRIGGGRVRVSGESQVMQT